MDTINSNEGIFDETTPVMVNDSTTESLLQFQRREAIFQINEYNNNNNNNEEFVNLEGSDTVEVTGDWEEVLDFDSPELIHERILEKLEGTRRAYREAYASIRDQLMERINEQNRDEDEDRQLDEEIAEVERRCQEEDEKNAELQKQIDNVQLQKAELKKGSPELLLLEKEYRSVKGEYEKLKEKNADYVEHLDYLTPGFEKTYGIKFAIPEGDNQGLAVVLNKIDPKDPERRFFIYLDSLSSLRSGAFKITDIRPEFAGRRDMKKLIQEANEEQNLGSFLVAIREKWIEMCSTGTRTSAFTSFD